MRSSSAVKKMLEAAKLFLKKYLTSYRNKLYTSRAGCVSGPRINGVLAQLGEHLPYKQRVIGSSPIGPIWEAGDGFPVVLLNLYMAR